MKKDKIQHLLQSAQNILLVTHKNPDGDGVGALVALSLSLERASKRIFPVIEDPISPVYSSLAGAEKIQRTLPPDTDKIDLGFSLDAADMMRFTPTVREVLEHRRFPLVNLDHHPGNQGFGDFNILDAQACSTAMLVFRFLKEVQLTITPDIASALYVGYLIDTGRFSFQNTTAETLRDAMELIQLGADPYRMNSLLYFSLPRSHLKLLGRSLERFSLLNGTRLGWSQLHRQDFQDVNADPSDVEGIPEFLLTGQDVDIILLFVESIQDDRIRISFRSKGDIDISHLARALGGGGHRNAAGAQMPGPLQEVIQYVLRQASAFLSAP